MIRYIAATGSLGYGFLESTLDAAMAASPDFIGCDAGSNDHGPNDLGAGIPHVSVASVTRDLRLLLTRARSAKIPLIIGSAGGSGADVHIEWTLNILKAIARQERLTFRLAVIYSDVPINWLKEAVAKGRVRALDGHYEPPSVELLDQTTRIVAQMGAEPFIEALSGGAEVIIAGRSTDAAIYSALPIMRGASPALAWHAGKIVECGAALVVHRKVPDCVMAEIGDDHFRVWSPNAEFDVTPQSVLAHTLYENSDPFRLVEPGYVLDTRDADYVTSPQGGVIVSGARHEMPPYTVKLEGARKAGYRSITLGGIRDPLILENLSAFMKSLEERTRSKIATVLPATTRFDLRYRIYGYNGTLENSEPRQHSFDGYEVGLVIDAIAESQELADTVLSIARLTALHQPVLRSHGFTSNIAFPFAPSDISVGEVYEWTLNHVVELDDPLELFPIKYYNVLQGELASLEVVL